MKLDFPTFGKLRNKNKITNNPVFLLLAYLITIQIINSVFNMIVFSNVKQSITRSHLVYNLA